MQRKEKRPVCSYVKTMEWTPRWLSKQFISLRSLSAPDSHRSDMTDQDKWSGSDVRSVQSSDCPRQKQKGTLSTRLSSLQWLFNSFIPQCIHNKTGNVHRNWIFMIKKVNKHLHYCHWIPDQTFYVPLWVITCLLTQGQKSDKGRSAVESSTVRDLSNFGGVESLFWVTAVILSVGSGRMRLQQPTLSE